MDLIDEFMARYEREYDYYERAARLVAQRIDASLQSAGVRCIVSSRAKSSKRLEKKCRQRAADKAYNTLEDIAEDIVDLAGVRVALYFPGDRDQVGRVIERMFTGLRPPRVFPQVGDRRAGRRFDGYAATHYLVQLPESSLADSERRYSQARVEVQVASVLMHAWSEVEHDLIYKPLDSQASAEEVAILDMLNGLVSSGEVALEQLQRAGQRRIEADRRPFANHFEVAAYLASHPPLELKRGLSDSDVGRVDLLFELMSRCRVDTPSLLRPYVEALDADVESRPIADQIIDQLLAEDSSRYPVFDSVRESAHLRLRGDDSQALVLGRFIHTWIRFEQLVASLSRVTTEKGIPTLPARIRSLASAGLIEPSDLRAIERIRRMRNQLVHGIEMPDPADLLDAMSSLEGLIAKIRRAAEDVGWWKPSPGTD